METVDFSRKTIAFWVPHLKIQSLRPRSKKYLDLNIQNQLSNPHFGGQQYGVCFKAHGSKNIDIGHLQYCWQKMKFLIYLKYDLLSSESDSYIS